MRQEFVGPVLEAKGQRRVRDPFRPAGMATIALAPTAELPPVGAWVHARLVEGCEPPLAEVLGAPLAEPGSALALAYATASRFRCDPLHPAEALREAEQLCERPGLDDPALVDLRHLAFITIDNADSRDLDQALHIERTADGYLVRYALADAAWYVRPGSALFEEALRRGASYYLPGLSIPMLPRSLSEGVISLNPGVDRRALVFELRLGADGGHVSTELRRALVHSRRKLTYPGVQEFLSAQPGAPATTPPTAVGHTWDDEDFAPSLRLLAVVGALRLAEAAERDVVHYMRRPVEAVPPSDPSDSQFGLVREARTQVDRYNEQISLLCNTAGAHLLASAAQKLGRPLPNLQPVYRTHAAPPGRRLQELAELVEALVRGRDLDPERWSWRRSAGETLADYLARLPEQGPESRITLAIHTQALRTNERSMFAAEPLGHYGVGAEVYARFSAPMREIVGIFTHKEAIELLEGHGGDPPDEDEELRAAVIEAGNRAKGRQSALTKAVEGLAIEQLLERDLALPLAERPRRRGTVTGMSPGRAYVQLDDPPIQLKVYLEDLTAARGHRWAVESGNVRLLGPEERRWHVGDAMDLRVLRHRRGRWLLEPLGAPASGRLPTGPTPTGEESLDQPEANTKG